MSSWRSSTSRTGLRVLYGKEADVLFGGEGGVWETVRCLRDREVSWQVFGRYAGFEMFVYCEDSRHSKELEGEQERVA